MRIKSQPSTAQKLALFREHLAQHYRALRSQSPLARKTPKPSTAQFDGYALRMAFVIEEEEQEKHLTALAEIERMKAMNTP